MATITTILGEMDESELEKTEATSENDNESVTWIEYRLKGDPPPSVVNGICLDCLDKKCQHVHRSVIIQLKRGVELESTIGTFN